MDFKKHEETKQRSDNFKKILLEILGEILKHKFLESEKYKKDVGMKSAMEDWIPVHLDSYIKSRKKTNDLIPTKQVVKELVVTIQHYKWLESEKRNFDIGEELAIKEWFEKYFPQWMKYNYDEVP